MTDEQRAEALREARQFRKKPVVIAELLCFLEGRE